MNEQELKDFIGIVITELKTEISRLSGVVDKQNAMLRDIEIKSVTRVAELQKDIDELRRDVTDVKTEQKGMVDSQKFRWRTLSEERTRERDEREEKERKQAVVNSSITTINRLLWLILGIVSSIGFTFVWDLIRNGGMKGLITP